MTFVAQYCDTLEIEFLIGFYYSLEKYAIYSQPYSDRKKNIVFNEIETFGML